MHTSNYCVAMCDILDLQTRVLRSTQMWVLFITVSGLVSKGFVEVSLRISRDFPKMRGVKEKIIHDTH